MKKHMTRLFGLSFLLFFMSAQAHAETLFGYNGTNDTLYTIATTTPSATIIGTESRDISPEIELGGGVIYATADDGTYTNTYLYSIDPATGLTTSTLTTTLPADGNVLTALEFVGNTLYAGLTTGGGGATFLATVNLTTGIVTTVGPTGANSPFGGLAYDTRTSIMYAVTAGGSAGRLFTVNLATGAATVVGPITVGGTAIGTTALEFGPSGTLYALPNPKDALAGHLLTVNPGTGAATDLGDLGISDMNALTAGPIILPPTPVPVSSEWGMLFMGLLFFICGIQNDSKKPGHTCLNISVFTIQRYSLQNPFSCSVKRVSLFLFNI